MVRVCVCVCLSVCYFCMYLCVYVNASLFASHFVTADEQWRGEWFRDIKKASEKRHVKIPPPQTSAKTLALLQLQSQTLSQNTSIICSPMCELLPHIQLFTSHFTHLFEYRKRRGGMA